MGERVDIAVVGLGAAGLMAAIWAGRRVRELERAGGRSLRVVGFDGAARLGAKILVAGGGRCNVTHFEVGERDYAGASPNAIKKVLRSFDVARTVGFFREIGVELKREETGKLFPVTDSARTVLDALLGAAGEAGVELRHPARVGGVRVVGAAAGERDEVGAAGGVGSAEGEFGFEVAGSGGTVAASRVILATGGMALPRSGSDGFGYSIAKGLGHTVTPAVFPALVPLKVEAGHPLMALAGVAAPAAVEVRASTGKRLASFTGAVLCTHFGLSGPAVMNMSRHLTAARREDAGAGLVLNWLPESQEQDVDRVLLEAGRERVGRVVDRLAGNGVLASRLIETLCRCAGVEADAPASSLTRERRRGLVGVLCRMEVGVTGDRGFTFAEATAGGVPLSEVHLATMASRVCPGLHLCGEILDVDGRIGGFNFQWAWASGFVAGCGAVGAMGDE
ncbi:MAG: aminoacetone oxidase family FAD-binding enzyme [Phycisphaerales bacterium]